MLLPYLYCDPIYGVTRRIERCIYESHAWLRDIFIVYEVPCTTKGVPTGALSRLVVYLCISGILRSVYLRSLTRLGVSLRVTCTIGDVHMSHSVCIYDHSNDYECSYTRSLTRLVVFVGSHSSRCAPLDTQHNYHVSN